MGPQGDRRASWDRLAGQYGHFQSQIFVFVQPNDPSMLCDRLMDPFLYSFCHRLIKLPLLCHKIMVCVLSTLSLGSGECSLFLSGLLFSAFGCLEDDGGKERCALLYLSTTEICPTSLVCLDNAVSMASSSHEDRSYA